MNTQKEAYLQKKLEDGKVRCLTCHRRCIIAPGKMGFCRTRENLSGTLYSLEYGLISSLSVNPIEKKPLFHFFPGTFFLTAGSWSCTFTCPWCQNYQISKAAPKNKTAQSQVMSPAEFVQTAKKYNCKGTSMSLSEPTTFLEYSLDVFKLARKENLYNTVITNGYFTSEALDLLLESGADAFNVDIKGSRETYEKYCKADVEKVWQNVIKIKQKAHLELTTLVIPGVNDDNECLVEIAQRIKSDVGADTPWHLSRYFPAYKFDVPATPIETLEKAHSIGKEQGLLYVYLGNVPGHKYENTYCPSCSEELIRRNVFAIIENKLGKDKKCPKCGEVIPVIDDK